MKASEPPPTVPFQPIDLSPHDGSPGDRLCRTCRHWMEIQTGTMMDVKAGRQGTCMFNPPQLFIIGAMHEKIRGAPIQPMFGKARPQMQSEDFCGQWTGGTL